MNPKLRLGRDRKNWTMGNGAAPDPICCPEFWFSNECKPVLKFCKKARTDWLAARAASPWSLMNTFVVASLNAATTGSEVVAELPEEIVGVWPFRSWWICIWVQVRYCRCMAAPAQSVPITRHHVCLEGLNSYEHESTLAGEMFWKMRRETWASGWQPDPYF